MLQKFISAENRSFYRRVFALVVPMAFQNLINVGVTTADVVMLGRVGETVLSGSSLAGQIQFILSLVFFGLTSGAAVLTAQYWGKKDIRTIEKVIAIALKISFVIAVIFTLAALLIPNLLMKIFTSEADVIAEGVKYLRIVSFSYLFMSITMIYLNIMRSVERVIISTVVYLVSLCTNIVLNAIFIFGLFGFPAMGIEGAALATLIARGVELVIVIFYAYKINKEVRLHRKDFFHTDKLLLRDFFVYSMPVIINELMWGAGSSANTAVIGHLGSSAVAANSVAQVTRQLATVVTFGLSNATAIILGKVIGEMKFELAKIYAKKLVWLSIVCGTVGGLLILALRPFIISSMSISEQAGEYLGFMLFVMSYFALCQAYNTTMVVGVFRSGGDTKFGLFLDVSTMWGISILFGAIAAFFFHCDVAVVYVILMSDEVIKIPITTMRYKSMKWLKNVTR
jgi:putative MATE family efflux protein